MADWMIYGATGYTGVLVAEEAVRRGHKPLLAGRSEAKLKPLAERLGLEYAAVSLDETAALEKIVGSVKLVYHAAGPFTYTSQPMLQACLKMGAHYLDITGELPVLQNAFKYDAAAQEKGIVIIPGVGFDVIPSDCLLRYVADHLPDATHLEVVLDALSSGSDIGGGVSAGTAKSILEILAAVGNLMRQEGQLVPIPLGSGAKQFRFPHGERLAMPIPWGDLEVGYRTTQIPNITTYLTFPPTIIRLTRVMGWALRGLLKRRFIRNFAGKQIDHLIIGPSEHARQTGRSFIYARTSNAAGKQAAAWLETGEAYQFTAIAGVRVVEQVLDGAYRGALTPALAFGADFVLEIEGTRRMDSL
ncbi:MAG: saccharopine dehydrogenase NADP-binding domain-containing protein [Anaerolineae bacterium]|nr:saccharopine dehydrogenase NADP-binding domain-containing protein [Anaerolineae bacterium]